MMTKCYFNFVEPFIEQFSQNKICCLIITFIFPDEKLLKAEFFCLLI